MILNCHEECDEVITRARVRVADHRGPGQGPGAGQELRAGAGQELRAGAESHRGFVDIPAHDIYH